jgi:UDP:flavonoid glycosyltransferase YjiC (YdhE family)
VFVYVRPFESLPQLVSMLQERGVSGLVYAPGADPRLRERAPSGRLRFVDQPVDLTRAAAECDLAILNSTHGTTATMLLAGKPILQLPIHLEQQLVAERTVRLGAGLAANRTQPRQIAERLDTLLGSDRHSAAAQRFANRYSGFDPARQLGDMVGRIEQLSLSA